MTEPGPTASPMVTGWPVGTDAILGLGSNMGDGRANLARAIALLTADGAIRLTRRSRDYRTAPWGMVNQPAFVNASIGVATELPPHALLARCQTVEWEMGRIRLEHWGPRVIDVDILLIGTRVICAPDLVVPHPHIGARAFVLAPLLDIAPGLSLGGETVAALLAKADAAGIEAL